MPNENPLCCEVHGIAMQERAIRIRYGLIRGTPKVAPAYLEARSTGFPNCDDVVLGGCVVRQPKTKRKPICPACNAARELWLREHYPRWMAKHKPNEM